MNNIIQLIGEKVKREIEKDVVEALEGKSKLADIVDSVKEMVDDIGVKTLEAIMKELEEISKKTSARKGKYNVQRNDDERSLTTRFGNINFSRTYYKNIQKGGYVYLLDEILDIEKYERIEGNLKAEILEKSADVSYQKAAKLSTPVSITRESVKKIIRENDKIDNLEIKVKNKKSVETIYIEADEDHVAMQKGKSKEMKLIYVYDGIEKINKNRTKLKNLRYFTGEMKPEDMWFEVATYLEEAYEMDKVKNIYIAGDGASWIKTGLGIIKNSKYVLDHYHLNKYIKKLTAHLHNLENPVHISKPLWKYLKTGKKEYAKELINYAIEETQSESKIEAMKEARRYITNNWEGIQNLFKEEKYRCSAEGHISHILSSRLSSRPMGWSVIGADEMARLRAYKANGGSIKEYYKELRKKRKKEEKILELDEKFINHVKRTYNNIQPDTMIEMPYIRTTNGRWLKDMLQASSF